MKTTRVGNLLSPILEMRHERKKFTHATRRVILSSKRAPKQWSHASGLNLMMTVGSLFFSESVGNHSTINNLLTKRKTHLRPRLHHQLWQARRKPHVQHANSHPPRGGQLGLHPARRNPVCGTSSRRASCSLRPALTGLSDRSPTMGDGYTP